MSERRNLSYEAAVMYFVQGETMESIARRLGVSRSTVSRLVKGARDAGYVQISLHPPKELTNSLGMRIAQRYGIKTHVVPVPFGANEARRLQAVATMAGIVISDLVKPNTVIGVAWGNTVSAVADQLVPRAASGSVVVQLNGAANKNSTGIPYAGEIIARFGKAYGASVCHFPVPAFFDYAATREHLWRERSVAAVRQMQADADIAVFGVGALDGKIPSQVYAGGYLSPDELAQVCREGVVGDVCTVLLRADGSWEDLEINARASGPSPQLLRQIERRVCVVSGVEKARPLLAALRAGVVTDLIIDEDSAAKLEELTAAD
ncbi:sugar-binding transcriptional regulator [Arcanobacterium hippocoleae]|uniref:DNA-binding transcriptional regulator LsrR (DeoR family) n=1 Tax=Arcanobacterium hippocoleae TaxID=149017 RepID=A0ABU1T1W4_9ACTO|nr:sugar-binding domain-containing protein [Arcanobacterium hippocoleae]MDR6939304.1 DNA-binding transcriptional regulator LsrR (DeoR family) [Arcanobacterium hippocoleae]